MRSSPLAASTRGCSRPRRSGIGREAGLWIGHFAALAQARTVLLISHRPGSCRFAQRILVLEHGQLVEEGAHAALLAANRRYAGLYRMQAVW